MHRYRNDLKGVIVCYSKLQLMQKTGKIIDESPDIHFNVRLQALVFRPISGMELVGTVNKVLTLLRKIKVIADVIARSTMGMLDCWLAASSMPQSQPLTCMAIHLTKARTSGRCG
jgi:hypothetical protein